jgi:hypothetical protein
MWCINVKLFDAIAAHGRGVTLEQARELLPGIPPSSVTSAAHRLSSSSAKCRPLLGGSRLLMTAWFFAAFVAIASVAPKSHAAPFFEFTGTGQPGDYIGGGQSYFRDQNFGTVSVNVFDRTGDGEPDYLFNFVLGNTLGQFMFVTIGTNQLGQNLHPGVYMNAERAPFASLGHPGLDVGVDGRGCNMVTGNFVIYDVAFSSSTILDRLDVAFEQHCEGAPAAFIGRFRYDRTNPLSSLVTPVPTIHPMNLLFLATLMLAIAGLVLPVRGLLDGRNHQGASRRFWCICGV